MFGLHASVSPWIVDADSPASEPKNSARAESEIGPTSAEPGRGEAIGVDPGAGQVLGGVLGEDEGGEQGAAGR